MEVYSFLRNTPNLGIKWKNLFCKIQNTMYKYLESLFLFYFLLIFYDHNTALCFLQKTASYNYFIYFVTFHLFLKYHIIILSLLIHKKITLANIYTIWRQETRSNRTTWKRGKDWKFRISQRNHNLKLGLVMNLLAKSTKC